MRLLTSTLVLLAAVQVQAAGLDPTGLYDYVGRHLREVTRASTDKYICDSLFRYVCPTGIDMATHGMGSALYFDMRNQLTQSDTAANPLETSRPNKPRSDLTYYDKETLSLIAPFFSMYRPSLVGVLEDDVPFGETLLAASYLQGWHADDPDRVIKMYDEMTLEFIRVLDAYDYKLFANRGGLQKLRDDIREQLKKKMAMIQMYAGPANAKQSLASMVKKYNDMRDKLYRGNTTAKKLADDEANPGSVAYRLLHFRKLGAARVAARMVRQDLKRDYGEGGDKMIKGLTHVLRDSRTGDLASRVLPALLNANSLLRIADLQWEHGGHDKRAAYPPLIFYSTVGTEIAIEFLKASRDKNHVPESRNCSYEYFKSFCLAGNDKGCEKQLEQVGVEEEEIIYGTAIQLSFEAWRRNYPLPAFYGDKPLATIVFRELTIGDMFFAAWAVQKCDSYTRTLPSKESWGMRTLIDAASANHPYWIEQCGERDYMQRVERCPLLLPKEYHVDL